MLSDIEKEQRRLKALSLYEIMDSANEKVFDDLTRLAATICNTPISLISLVDDKRQWFKSRVGLDATETPREYAFCAHAILQDELMEVKDAKLDERFKNNPLVTNDPKIRFYAGMPLSTPEGEKLGTLCVIDQKPHKLDENQVESLKILSEAVQGYLELRRARIELGELKKLVPLCAWCKNIRVEDGSSEDWVPLHKYLEDNVPVSHSICPDCKEKFVD